MSPHDCNGWTFELEEEAVTREDGTGPALYWVYRNVKNWGYNFASEISIEKIIVEVKTGEDSKPRLLEHAQFEAQSWEETFELVPVRTLEGAYVFSLANFSVYQGKGPVLKLRTKAGVLPPNEVDGEQVDEPLYLFVTFSFSEYGNDPPHEFTGALAAARFTPAIRFETKNESVQSIRVDYRFHFDLDSYLKTASLPAMGWAELKEAIRGRENYALVIRDADHFPPSVLGVVRLFKDVFALKEGVDFFNARLDECGYGGMCRLQCFSLELKLAPAGEKAGDRLDVTFYPPGVALANPLTPPAKTTVAVKDENVAALLGAGPDDYDAALVDSLTAKIFKVVRGAMPAQGIGVDVGSNVVTLVNSGVSNECLSRCIKHTLLRLVARSYVLRTGAAILERLGPLSKTIRSDLEDVMEDVELSDLEKVLADIAVLIPLLLMVPPPFTLLSPVALAMLLKLALDMQELAGKLISIAGFDAAEKPVLRELVGRFVDNGEVTCTWDNMHWWGTEKIPSAPGAFFAVHSHFRWTQLNAYPTPEEAEAIGMLNTIVRGPPLHLGASQLRSLVKRFAENQLSGPLIDPGIPNQSILFAIALSGGALDKTLLDKTSKASTQPFDQVRLEPQPIAWVRTQGNQGSDIAYWVSCKARREGEEVFKGTLLVNGFYFAHDEEKPFSLSRSSNMFAPTEGIPLQKPERIAPYALVRNPCGIV